jgi:hypothetical protein
VKILVVLLIASFVALDFYLWDSLQMLWSAREENYHKKTTSLKIKIHKSNYGRDQVAPEDENRE